MKILHLSTYDTIGGAARAATRLHVGLGELGVTSSMLVRRKRTQLDTVHVAPPLKVNRLTGIPRQVTSAIVSVPVLLSAPAWPAK